MGVAASTSTSTLMDNESLLKLSGTQTVPSDDPMWEELVQFQLVLPRVCGENIRIFEVEVASICRRLAKNCMQSGNFKTLVDLLGTHVRAIVNEDSGMDGTDTEGNSGRVAGNQTKASERKAWYLHNVMLILRVFCKYVLDNEDEALVEQIFECRDLNDEHSVPTSSKTDMLEESLPSSSSNHSSIHNHRVNGLYDDRVKIQRNAKEDMCSVNRCSNNGTLALYLSHLWSVIVQVEVTGITFGVALEATTSLLVLLSHRLYHILADKHECVSQHVLMNTSIMVRSSETAKETDVQEKTDAVANDSSENGNGNKENLFTANVYDITQALLSNFMDNKLAPERPRSFLSSIWGGSGLSQTPAATTGVGGTYDVSSAFTFPFLFQESSEVPVSLGKESLLLLLTLNCKRGSAECSMGAHGAVVNENTPIQGSGNDSMNNVIYTRTSRISSAVDLSLLEKFQLIRKYKFPHALATLTNHETTTAVSSSAGRREKTLSFGRLYRTFCRLVGEEEAVAILLYILLSDNADFRAFVLSRTDLENLTIPLLQMLLNGAGSAGHRAEKDYVVLCIILIISQDASFNKFVHDMVLPDAPWFKEKVVTQISLGSLIVITIVRVMLNNLVKERDAYLQTICLAILANMSLCFTNLHIFAAQRIIRLFDIFAKKFQKIDGFHRLSVLEADFLNTKDDEGLHIESSLESDVLIYAEFLRILLEIIDNAFTYGLASNPHLIYNMLQKRDILDNFQVSSHFADIVVNIEYILDYFQAKIEALPHNSITHYDTVFQCIIETAKNFSSKMIKPLPQLTFQQAEDITTSDFFQTYVWSLVVRSAPEFWDRSRIVFFDAVRQ
eukprot:CFRG1613T1